jgi:hypothetical protein
VSALYKLKSSPEVCKTCLTNFGVKVKSPCEDILAKLDLSDKIVNKQKKLITILKSGKTEQAELIASLQAKSSPQEVPVYYLVSMGFGLIMVSVALIMLIQSSLIG